MRLGFVLAERSLDRRARRVLRFISFIHKVFEWIVAFYIVRDQQSDAVFALADQRSARNTAVDTPNTPNLRL